MLDPELRHRIHKKACELYSCATGNPPDQTPEISFDLSGKAAGQWQVRGKRQRIRLNPAAFVYDWDAHFPATIAHEIAHAAVYQKTYPRRVKPHGPEWQAVMRKLGCEPRVTHDTPLPRVRRTRRYTYVCDCGRHALTSQRHALIQKRQYRYQCRACGGWLRPLVQDERPE
ncbi:MAG: SprT-like domain-containing protein [Thioalkalivibrio sp.]|nr:SprT-like domain-containing protein [Thioalkalivibrio sp.]